ncbi:MAG: hypothetical protein JWM00_469 [Candidatus Saccharibacteria bacterium]|nr:hypothetical protein [Candidatus Saccharibacteria bacterium]
MDDEESLNQPATMVDDDQKRPTPYELLLRQSRKMGQTATRTYDVTKEFLKQDVTVLYPPQIKQTNATRSAKKLNKIVAQSKEILAIAQTVMLPNNLFPDTLVVDRTKVTITIRTFFWSSSVISIRIEDILNVTTSVGPLFGSLTISSRVMNSTDHYQINYFWRRDAIRLKQVLQGYMIAVHNTVDTSHLTKDELIEKLVELGHDPSS